MYFEALLKKKKYQINVSKRDYVWFVQLKEEGSDEWDEFHIPYSDFEEADNIISFIFNHESYLVDVVSDGLDCQVYSRGSYRDLKIYNDEMLLHESLKSGGMGGNDSSLRAGMPGKIVKILVNEGDEVAAGKPLLVMEAMKMENEMKAPSNVKITKLHVKPGDNVESGATLISF
ncbi:MAG: acetyl-CoA carboxylase biotin carboxyl carrier protein subunit [Bdellovibrionaceae bacterium]|nr:acetyl-CoA carboxylase biotin carboxyl carrier protein subunit [Pseudobdellovibrionaceae bacterium]